MTDVVRKSKYFVMRKDVRRRQKGRGSRFQNHKITSYEITSAMGFWSAAWSPSDIEVTKVLNADYFDDTGRRTWTFNNKKAADKAWMLLMLKYGD